MQHAVSPRPEVWGHRGAMDFAPQNTLPSFVVAQDQGADGVELDVQLTKDGVPVVFHDPRVDRLTDGRGPLADLPWALVRKLDAGGHFGRAWRGTPIPTLEAVLEVLDARMTVNIELKTSLTEAPCWRKTKALLWGPGAVPRGRADRARDEAEPLVRAVAAVVARVAPNRVWISSFDPWALFAAEQWLPAFRRGFLHSPTTPWRTAPWMEGHPCQAWHPHHSEVTPQSVAQARQGAQRVHVWTVNDPWHGSRLAALGVDALITNRPGEIRAALG